MLTRRRLDLLQLARAAYVSAFVPVAAAAAVVLNMLFPAGVGALRPSQLLFGSIFATLPPLIVRNGRISISSLRPVAPLLLLALYAFAFSIALELSEPVRTRGLLPDVNFGLRVAYLVTVFAAAYVVFSKGRQASRYLANSAWLVVFLLLLSHYLFAAPQRLISSRDVGTYVLSSRALISAGAVAIAPVFLLHRGFRRWLGIGLCVIIGMLTLRRSGVIAIGGGTLAALIYEYRTSDPSGRVKWVAGFAVLAAMLAAFVELNPAAPDFLDRLQDLRTSAGGSGSGRYVIWPLAVRSIAGRDLVHVVLGMGTGSLESPLLATFGLAIGAHSDWIDMVASFGMVGVILLFVFFVYAARITSRLVAARSPVAPASIACFLSLLLLSIGTGGTLDPIMTPAFVLLAYLHGVSLRSRPTRLVDRVA